MTPATLQAFDRLEVPITEATDVELQAAAHQVAPTDYSVYEAILTELRDRKAGRRTPQPVSYSAADLQSMRFAEPKWAVESLIPDGLTLLAGKPKTGKSWLALGIAVAIAMGDPALGGFPVQQGSVLYAALEDKPQRLQKRMELLLGAERWPEALRFKHEWNRLDDGGLDDLTAELDRWPDLRLVIFDTLAKIRPTTDRSRRLYDADYQALGPLQSLAADRGLAILINHHQRKLDATDWVDSISGTSGLTGVVDTVLGLFRERGRADAELRGTGRDIDEFEIALSFDGGRGTWTHLGEASEFRMSEERAEIIALFRQDQQLMKPGEVAAALDRAPEATRKLMWTMGNQGQLHALGNGEYALPVGTGNSGNTGNGGVTTVTTVTDPDLNRERP